MCKCRIDRRWRGINWRCSERQWVLSWIHRSSSAEVKRRPEVVENSQLKSLRLGSEVNEPLKVREFQMTLDLATDDVQ